MLHVWKVFVRGIPIGFTLLALALAGGITSLQATPVCPTTIVLPGGSGSVPDFMLTAGVCVESQEKLFGNSDLLNMPQPGTVLFGIVMMGGIDRHTITFSTYNPRFDVLVLGGMFITQASASFIQSIGGLTMLTQTTPLASSGSGSINLSKSDNSPSGTVISITPAQNVTDLGVSGVSSASTVGPDSGTSSVLGTIVEPTPLATPEPAARELFGLALTGLGAFAVRRKS